ncbi:MAG: DUF349 domain-containing protein [Bacteroidota bacterium]|jgi:hypothetical protein|nr:DUF349 domain-containing protein [Cytophagales bacterium]MCE2958856.1 DUF349 domain-containing protein [Flammeovirgaceae bacterium]MCZ8072058.1 DUF349 domain-containing protein [Cytophagales bacterium]
MTTENGLPLQNDLLNSEVLDVTMPQPLAEAALHDLVEEEKPIDFSQFTKHDFVALLKDLSREEDFKKVDRLLKEAKPLYDEIREGEKQAALQRFLAEGGKKDDFDYRIDELDHQFDATLKLIRDRRNQYYKNLEERKAEGLRIKNEILEKLRVLVDGEDSPATFHQFKELQREWKNSGPVPASHAKEMWASYNAIIDRFYDHRNIYFELKELDRKKNLEAKRELVAKANRLLTEKSIAVAVRELNELHNEFKHIGPVPKEEQEALWQLFKGASDKVYAKRDEFVATLQAELTKNMDAKIALGELVAVFGTFTSDKIKEWNQKTKEILELQKKWDAIGGVPRSKQKDVNKKFWTPFKQFFHNKSLFFKKLDEERNQNLKLKEEIVAKAVALKDSTDWDKTSNELKALQAQWKEIGPVPEKQREKVFAQFKEACDFFFEQLRGLQSKANQEQLDNLAKKEAIITELQQMMETKAVTLDVIRTLQAKFNEIGFVPKKDVASVRSRFNESVSKALSSIENLSAEDRNDAELEIQLHGLKNDPQADRKIIHKEQMVRKQISKVENDIAVLRNNLAFFERSKNADQMKQEYGKKVEELTDHLQHLKKQLKMLNQA